MAAFLHLLGFTMAGPITPPLAAHFSLTGAHLGALTSAYPLGMLGALFVWPRLSDLVGRKPVLVASLLGVGVGLLLQGVAVARGWSLEAFLALRVASGLCSGASPVAKAYLADTLDPASLPRWMAWREAASTLAFIVGPTLGGVLFVESSLATVISSAGAASVGAALMVALVLVERRRSDKPPAAATEAPLSSSSSSSSNTAVVCPLGAKLYQAVATICVVSALYHVGQVSFDAFFAVHASAAFGMDARQVGALLTTNACVSFGVSTLLFSPVSARVGITPTSVLGLCLVAAGLAAVGVAATPAALVASALAYGVGVPLFTPTVPILLLQCVPPSQRGTVMGVDSAVNTVSRVVAPLVLGELYKTSGAAACFAAAAAAVVLSAAVTAARRAAVLREQAVETAPP